VSRYHDLTTALAERIAAGEPAPGASLPPVRALAAEQGTTPTTALRAYRELAAAGVIVSEPRRAARVAPDGALAARWLLRGGRAFRLAGSDDPALSLLVARSARQVTAVGARGSFRGLTALWSGAADGAALHLRHRSGEYNAPFARGVLADAGLGLRSSARALELDFVPLAWEPFQVATTEPEAGGVRPLIDLLADPGVHGRIAGLGGYDLAGAGEVVPVA
jgi:hypothetical protein